MVDNLEKIKDLLTFDSEDSFYFLQILQRKKENPHLGRNSRVVKTYYITSLNYLEDHYEEIKSICNLFNARASINLNCKSFHKAWLEHNHIIANMLDSGDLRHVYKAYESACGKSLSVVSQKIWLVDVDECHLEFLPEILQDIFVCDPVGDKVLSKLPSKTGFHLVTKPFNLQQFNIRIENIPGMTCLDIHKNNPTNLYIP